ncbi:MAG: ATP-grasp domain-containing protein [Actinobacteria bacterium]|nr:ATP-grasp domain-containing protein [Actinomycetota bacterium]
MDALVTDVDLREALAGLRGLGRSGLDLVALGPHWSAAGLWSRYPTARAMGPNALTAPAAFVATVSRLARQHGPLVVYPGREEAITTLLEAASKPDFPAGARLPYPEAAPVRTIRDKRRLPELAAGAGLKAAETVLEGTVENLASTSLPLPCLIKPAHPGGALKSVQPVDSAYELDAVLASLPSSEPLLVQRRIEGPLVAIALVVGREGQVVARFQQEALRTWPPGAGPSSLAVSVAPDEALVARVAAMLREAGYWGLADLQFVASTAGPALIDVNPRFYGSLPLALACGVNLPAAWHAVTVGAPLPEPVSYPVGRTYRWLEADLVAALRGAPRLLLGSGSRPRVGAVWAAEDPFASAVLSGRGVVQRLARRIGRARATA